MDVDTSIAMHHILRVKQKHLCCYSVPPASSHHVCTTRCLWTFPPKTNILLNAGTQFMNVAVDECWRYCQSPGYFFLFYILCCCIFVFSHSLSVKINWGIFASVFNYWLKIFHFLFLFCFPSHWYRLRIFLCTHRKKITARLECHQNKRQIKTKLANKWNSAWIVDKLWKGSEM